MTTTATPVLLTRRSAPTHPAIPDLDAADVWAYGQEACCKARKVDLLDRALAGKVAWLSGLRRDDSGARASAPIVEVDRRGLIKVNPMAAWPADDADAYGRDHDVIRNPLLADGYTSTGCWPCTELPAPGADPRSGRWAGSTRTECGLHL